LFLRRTASSWRLGHLWRLRLVLVGRLQTVYGNIVSLVSELQGKIFRSTFENFERTIIWGLQRGFSRVMSDKNKFCFIEGARNMSRDAGSSMSRCWDGAQVADTFTFVSVLVEPILVCCLGKNRLEL